MHSMSVARSCRWLLQSRHLMQPMRVRPMLPSYDTVRRYASTPTAGPNATASQITSNPAIMATLQKLIKTMEAQGLSAESMPTDEQWESLTSSPEVQACLEELRVACDAAGIDPSAHIMEAMADKTKPE